MSKVMLAAFESGMKFDAWTEYFSYEKWLAAFDAAGLDIAFYANRRFENDEILPWDIIDCGVTKEFFAREREKAYSAKTTENCKQSCSACGANKLLGERSWCPNAKNKLS